MTLSRSQLLRLRLVSQRLLATGSTPPARTPADAVRWMIALQAQDLPGACYSVGLRTSHSHAGGQSAVVAALDAGTVVRSWPLRGTLHLLSPQDLALILPLTAQRSVRAAATRHRQLGICPADVEQCRDLALAALGARLGSPRAGMTRAELLGLFETRGQSTAGQRGIHLIWLLCQQAALVQGPMSGRHQLFVGYDSWVGPSPELDPEDALSRLALRYFRSRGPATARDFAWWAQLPISAARSALASVRSELVEAELDGTTYWLSPEVAALHAGGLPGQRTLWALPGFDEYLLGYTDRSGPVAAEHSARIVPGNNGMFRATIVYGGRVIGTWRTATRTGGGAIPEPFGELTPRQAAAFARASAAHQRFVRS